MSRQKGGEVCGGLIKVNEERRMLLISMQHNHFLTGEVAWRLPSLLVLG